MRFIKFLICLPFFVVLALLLMPADDNDPTPTVTATVGVIQEIRITEPTATLSWLDQQKVNCWAYGGEVGCLNDECTVFYCTAEEMAPIDGPKERMPIHQDDLGAYLESIKPTPTAHMILPTFTPGP